MSPFETGIVGIIILLLFLALRMPVGFSMALVGFGGFWYLVSFKAAFSIIGMVPFATGSSYILSVIPLFLLMGQFAFYSGMSKDIYDTSYKWLGFLPGGLAIATIGACAGFAAICGSSVATCATMGQLALPEMKRYGYSNKLATGSIAVGATLGVLIPPSVVFIIYGLLTEQSIGRLFIAGIFPGLISTFFYMVTIYLLCKKNPEIGPVGPRISIRERLKALKGAVFISFVFFLVVGGMYFGIFTPTEAAAAGAFSTFCIGLARKKIGWGNLQNCLLSVGWNTSMLFTILIGAMIFGYFLAVTRIPMSLAAIVSGLQVSPYLIMTIIVLFFMISGCFMEALAMIILTVPIFFPVITSLGFDPVWFGVICVRMAEMGAITPPVGVNIFIVKGAAPDIPTGSIIRGIVPFWLSDVFTLALLILFPQICLFLPNLLFE